MDTLEEVPKSRPRARSGQKLKQKHGFAQTTFNREQFQRGEEAFIAADLAQWINAALGVELEGKSLVAGLSSGEVLCDLLQYCGAPGIKGVKRGASAQQWHAKSNLELFNAAALRYGVDAQDVCTSADFEKGNLKTVENCLLAVARIAFFQYGIDLPAELRKEIESFESDIRHLDGRSVRVQAITDEFVGARGVDKVRLEIKATETELFTVVVHSARQISLQTAAGRYLGMGSAGKLTTSAVLIDDCKFSVKSPPKALRKGAPPGVVVLQTSSGRYLNADQGGGRVSALKATDRRSLFRIREVQKALQEAKSVVSDQPLGGSAMLDESVATVPIDDTMESAALLDNGEQSKKVCCCCNCCYSCCSCFVCDCCMTEVPIGNPNAEG